MDDTHPVPKLPPPIFIRLVNDFKSFCTTIHSVTNGEAFTCKSSTNGLKLSTSTPTSYRNVIKFLKDSKADFHTYQPKQERAFRIVVRNLHHTTSISDIEQELLSHGHTVRNITNVLQHITKRPLPLFFIDLEQADNNKEVFKIEFLCYSKIKIEEPRVKRHIVQCLRCQDYGHTKSYCNHSPNCVRCGEQHLSETCQKPTNQPPKCVLCKGEHPANYRGCPKHKEIQSSQLHRLKTSQHSGLPNQNLPVKKVSPNTVNTTSNSLSHHKTSYAQLSINSCQKAMTYNSNNIQHPITLFLWNANGLIHQKNELKALLHTLNLDLILISEAHLTPNTSFKIPGYQTYHCDHPDNTAHAGSAILIKSDIKHFILPSFQSGDFNSKHTAWGSRIINTRGRILYNISVNKSLKFISPPNPTYWPTHQNRLPDTLDFFLTNLPNHINYSISNSTDLSSDHTPVLLCLNDHYVDKTTYPTITPGKTNWNLFSKTVEAQIQLNVSLKDHSEIDAAIHSLTNIIQNSALSSSFPTHLNTKYGNLPQYLRNLITEKRRARSKWQRTHLPSDKITFNQLNCNLKNLLRKHNSNSYQNYIKSITNSDKSLWKATKNLLKEKNIVPPLRNTDNSYAISNIDKANLFATHLARFSGYFFGLVDLLRLDKESNIALWMLFVSLRAASSMSCAFLMVFLELFYYLRYL
ncbi:hypothetical protein QTP88_007892 [Uroleucon formosanum]